MRSDQKRSHTIVKRLEWHDQPAAPVVNKVGKWAAVAKRMRRIDVKNHGKWARVATDVHFTLASRLKKQYPDVAWTIRKNSDGKHDLWASYPATTVRSDVVV